jgi:hypothetical protein
MYLNERRAVPRRDLDARPSDPLQNLPVVGMQPAPEHQPHGT